MTEQTFKKLLYTAHLIGYQNIYIIQMASCDESSLKAVYKSVELRY